MSSAGDSSLAAGAAGESGSGLEPWRELFRGRDIYDVISKAILVAATDSPHEFRSRRDGIVEQIYTAPTTVPIPQGRAAAGERSGRALEVSDKGSKVASCTVVAPAEEPEDNDDDKKGIAAARQQANCDGDNAASTQIEMDWLLQDLADQVDAETEEVNEILRIKDILLNHHEQSSDILFDSLRRLQLMQLTADRIKGTEIGSAVAAVSKHKSHKIRMLVHEIVKDWKAILDDWIATTKATMMDSDSNKHMDISNTITTDDEGGLATPPMDIGALHLVSHATAFQNVSEFFHGMADDRIMTNLSMDKGGGDCRLSTSKFDGSKPSNSTAPWSKDPMIVQALPAIQQRPFDNVDHTQELPARKRRRPFDNGDPQELPASKRRPSWNTSPPVTYKKTQEQGSQFPWVRIKIKHSSTEYAPTGHSNKNTLDEKKPYEENQGTVTRISPVIAARELPPRQVLKKGMPPQSSAGPKRNVRLTEMDIDETKRKLRGAYQEAENSKQRRAIQLVDLSDIAKSRENCRPLTKPMNLTSRTLKMNRSQIIKSWENYRYK